MTRNLLIPYAMTAGGFLVILLAFFPIALSEWLPRWAQFLAGVWMAVVGIGLTVMLTAEDDER